MGKITLCLMAGAAIFFASCNSKSDIGGYIPEDAALVFHVNSASLSSKLSWKEIQETEWYKELQKEEKDSFAQKILQNPDSSGIDTKKDFFFFVRNSGKYSYFSLQGSLKDESAFEAFCKHAMKASETTKKEGLSYVKSDDAGIIAWKNNHFIFLSSTPNISGFAPLTRNRSMEYDRDYERQRKQPADSLVAYASSLFSLKGKSSLASDSRFAALAKEPGDMHYWLNGENFYGGMLGNFLSLTKVSTLLKGNVQAGTINFDNGKISARSRAYYNKELADFYKKYTSKNIDAEALAKIPSQNVLGVVAMNFPPEGLKEMVKLIGVDGFVNSFLGEMNYSLDEFVKANKGDLILAVSDLAANTTTETYTGPDGQSFSYPRTKTDIKVLFASSINDKAAFDKLVSAVQEQYGKAAAEEIMGKIPDISYTVNDQWFVAGNSKEQVDAFSAGGKNAHSFIEKMKGHSMGFYIDLQKIFTGIEGMAKEDEGESQALEASKKMWQDVLATGNVFEGNLEINLVDKNTNSLKQLNEYFNTLAKIMNEGRKQYEWKAESGIMPDTTAPAETIPLK